MQSKRWQGEKTIEKLVTEEKENVDATENKLIDNLVDVDQSKHPI